MAEYEVYLLRDHHFGEGDWHLYPDIRDVVGWWPDGAPAWMDDDEDREEAVREIIAVAPRRVPDDDGLLPITPEAEALIDVAMTLNTILEGRSPHIEEARAVGDVEAAARATAALVRQRLPEPAGFLAVMELGINIIRARRGDQPGGDRRG